MENLEPSKYILSNIESDEELVYVISSSKGLFNSNPDIAITTKRIFSRDKESNSQNFPLAKIKNVEAIPEKGLFGREKKNGEVVIYGPYKAKIVIKTNDVEELTTKIRSYLSKLKSKQK